MGINIDKDEINQLPLPLLSVNFGANLDLKENENTQKMLNPTEQNVVISIQNVGDPNNSFTSDKFIGMDNFLFFRVGIGDYSLCINPSRNSISSAAADLAKGR